jgi:hypothetical protein
MKKTSVLLFLVISLLSCVDDNNSNDNNSDTSIVSVSPIRNFIPAPYFNGNTLVFINSNGDSKRLLTSSSESVVEQALDDMPFKSEILQINFIDPDDSDFNLIMTGSGRPIGADQFLNLVTTLMPSNPSGSTFNTIIFKNGSPIVDVNDDFHTTLMLLGHEFKDVYASQGLNLSQEKYEAFSELYINSEVGIVGFRDRDNELWVLDSIE